MADAPKRIWANGLGCYGEADMGGTEYIRADIARADAELAVAEAIRRAAEIVAGKSFESRYTTWPWWGAGNRSEDSVLVQFTKAAEAAILSLAPGDALAEAQRLREERGAALARVERMREALRKIQAGPIYGHDMRHWIEWATNVVAPDALDEDARATGEPRPNTTPQEEK